MNLAKIRQIIGWTLIALLLIWIFLNRTSVPVHFLIFEAYMPVAVVIVLSAGAGAGAVLAFKYLKKMKKGDGSTS